MDRPNSIYKTEEKYSARFFRCWFVKKFYFSIDLSVETKRFPRVINNCAIHDKRQHLFSDLWKIISSSFSSYGRTAEEVLPPLRRRS